MAFRLLGQDAVVLVTLGGPQDGVPNWGAAVPIKALAKRYGLHDDVEKADMRSLGDGRRRTRVKATGSAFDFELLVPDSGLQFLGCIGYYCKIEFKELSSMSSYHAPIYGVITDYKWDGPDDAQTETLTIDADADGAV